VTLADVNHFAEFIGDTFYAHTDEQATAANPFFDGVPGAARLRDRHCRLRQLTRQSPTIRLPGRMHAVYRFVQRAHDHRG